MHYQLRGYDFTLKFKRSVDLVTMSRPFLKVINLITVRLAVFCGPVSNWKRMNIIVYTNGRRICNNNNQMNFCVNARLVQEVEKQIKSGHVRQYLLFVQKYRNERELIFPFSDDGNAVQGPIPSALILSFPFHKATISST
jgi:hypothetical protein